MSSSKGLNNPFIDLDKAFEDRIYRTKQGGNLEYGRWFRGKKVPHFMDLNM